jgi:hypothetical protein
MPSKKNKGKKGGAAAAPASTAPAPAPAPAPAQQQAPQQKQAPAQQKQAPAQQQAPQQKQAPKPVIDPVDIERKQRQQRQQRQRQQLRKELEELRRKQQIKKLTEQFDELRKYLGRPSPAVLAVLRRPSAFNDDLPSLSHPQHTIQKPSGQGGDSGSSRAPPRYTTRPSSGRGGGSASHIPRSPSIPIASTIYLPITTVSQINKESEKDGKSLLSQTPQTKSGGSSLAHKQTIQQQRPTGQGGGSASRMPRPQSVQTGFTLGSPSSTPSTKTGNNSRRKKSGKKK